MIRCVKPEDVSQIVEDEKRIFGDSLGEGMILNGINSDMYHYFVLEEDGIIKAYIGLWVDGSIAQILNFYVKEEFRRCHLGTTMLEYAIEFLNSLKVLTISLEVRPSNLNAIDLYEKYGFEYSHKRKYYYNDGEDALVLILRKE
ncbi:MAG: ribosomal protein S18-alanine N-acetyltransferase [Anaeroplasmataceae bacterium]